MPSPCACPSPEVLSESTDLQNSKEVDGVAYEVDCALVTVKAGADVDIGTFICLDQFLAVLICSDQI